MAPALDYERYGLVEAKDRFSALTARANATGCPFTVLKGGKPWVEVRPLAVCQPEISIAPVRRVVPVADLDELFAGYDGAYVPAEDGFASPAGCEAMQVYRCGDVVWADLDPSAGHEQRKRRPLIVVSNDKFNARCNLTMTVPITSTDSGYPLHISVGKVPPEDGGAPVCGFAEIEQLKSLDLDARRAVKVGAIDAAGMDRVLSMVLGCLIAPDMSIVAGY